MTTKQRAYLKSLAMTMDPIFQVGKNSMTPEFTKAIAEALEARELIKISVLKNCADDPKELASLLAERTRSQVVQVIGKKIVLYKEGKDKNKKIAIATAGVATGAVVGTIAGVLIAPKSGKETIEDVKEKSNQVKNKINENIEDTKFKVKESKDKIKEYLAKRKNEKSENEIVEIEPLQLIENTEVAEENTEA